jgi:hypothetical protein
MAAYSVIEIAIAVSFMECVDQTPAAGRYQVLLDLIHGLEASFRPSCLMQVNDIGTRAKRAGLVSQAGPPDPTQSVDQVV